MTGLSVLKSPSGDVSDLLGTGMMREDLKVWGTPSDSTYFRAFRTCLCQLKGSVHGVTGDLSVFRLSNPGIMGVSCCCSSSVVCNLLKSLPL